MKVSEQNITMFILIQIIEYNLRQMKLKKKQMIV
jgi:hypothetical protein